YRANLQRAAKTQGAIQTANADRWRCSGTRCEAIYLSRGFGVPACQALVSSQGPVVSFTGYDSGNRRALRLTSAQLQQCNDYAQRAPRVVVDVGRSVPDTLSLVPDRVRTAQLVLVAKPQVPDTIRTRPLVLVGKLQVPDMVKTGPLVFVAKSTPQAVPDSVRTGALVLVGKPQVPDTLRTGPLILVGRRH
ncbi:MAG: hypothetical protein GXP11_07475, partial [Gammaproteobacteria bacterium]|nr:hypothetical protein [Gammaproteobacteria bacterium]